MKRSLAPARDCRARHLALAPRAPAPVAAASASPFWLMPSAVRPRVRQATPKPPVDTNLRPARWFKLADG